jgi:negative regulator of flagellin synthesis FlgM
MQIHGATHVHGAQAISGTHATRPTAGTQEAGLSAPINDEVSISSAGQLLDKLAQMPEIRQDRVDQIRAAIAEGVYETDAKLNMALDRLLDEIGG